MFQLKWIWKNLGKRKGLWVLGLFLSAVTSMMMMINPKLSQMMIDEVITPQKPDLLPWFLGAMLLTQLVRLLLRYGMNMSLECSSQHLIKNVRRRLYHVIENEDTRFFGSYTTGDLMTRMTGDLELIRHTTAWISFVVVDTVVLLTATLLYFFTVDALFTLVMLVVAPCIAVVSLLFSKKIQPIFVEVRERLSKLNTNAQENIAGNRVVRAFAREEFEKARVEEKNAAFRDINLKASLTWLKFQPFIDFLSQSLTIIVVVVGGLFLIGGRLTAGDLLAFSTLVWALANPLKNLGMLLNDIQRFLVSCSKIIEIYYAKPSIADQKRAVKREGRMQGAVEFSHVSLHLDQKEVLQDVSFRASPGSTIGIMGPTGSGKPSIANLITRLYDPSSGQVLVDGRDTREWTLASLRTSIGMATQEVFLFSDTIAGNIRHGAPEISDREVRRFAALAQADGFIKSMPQGYETLVGERGVGLSGGQKQRIALARALAVKPPILILDDTTSAVDMETEKAIQANLKDLPFPCTKIIIAQRVSSVRNAQRIYVLQEGRITEQGTHEELMQERGYYYSIWALQNNIETEKEASAYGAQPV